MVVELLTPLIVIVHVNFPVSSGKTSAMISEHTPLLKIGFHSLKYTVINWKYGVREIKAQASMNLQTFGRDLTECTDKPVINCKLVLA